METINTDFLTVEAAAQLAALSHWTLRRWLHLGRLTRYRLGKRTLVSRVELLQLLRPVKVSEPRRVQAKTAAL